MTSRPDFLLSARWPAPGKVAAGITLRRGSGIAQPSAPPYNDFNLAAHTGDNPNRVQAHRQAFSQAIGARQVQWLTQVHGTAHLRADAQTAQQAPEADAAWTDVAGLALAIMTADCVPVMLSHHQGLCVGAAHAGWQGLLAGVIPRLLSAMPAAADSLQAWIGPAISQASYEVGPDVWRAFNSDFPHRLQPVANQPHKRLLDLSGVAGDQLRAAGVKEVSVSGLCTYRDERFYSHRRAGHQGQGTTGRMASYILVHG